MQEDSRKLIVLHLGLRAKPALDFRLEEIELREMGVDEAREVEARIEKKLKEIERAGRKRDFVWPVWPFQAFGRPRPEGARSKDREGIRESAKGN